MESTRTFAFNGFKRLQNGKTEVQKKGNRHWTLTDIHNTREEKLREDMRLTDEWIRNERVFEIKDNRTAFLACWKKQVFRNRVWFIAHMTYVCKSRPVTFTNHLEPWLAFWPYCILFVPRTLFQIRAMIIYNNCMYILVFVYFMLFEFHILCFRFVCYWNLS